MKIALFITLVICSLPFAGQAQLNLVYNSGFEQYTNCPSTLDEVKYATFWNGIDTSWRPGMADSLDPQCLPDYVNVCSSMSCCSEPHNGHFYQYPHSGSGMMQVLMFYDDTFPLVRNARDYLQGRLRSTLIAGQSYCVTFYTVMDNGAGYAINHIGAYLDDGIMDTTVMCGQPQTTHTPQILDTTIIADTFNWIKIQGSFISNGTEKFITIGNFFDTGHTAHIRRISGEHLSPYLIDDISVIASNAPAYAGPDQTITAGCYTNIGVDSSGDGMPCYWYILGGTTPIDSGGTILVHPLTTTTYVVSMDLCGTVTYDTVTVNVTPCTGLPAVSFTDTGSSTVGFSYTGVVGCIDTISWNFGDGSASNAVNPVHTYSAVGTYTVCVTDYTYCGSNSDCQTVTITCPTPVAAFTDTGATTVGFTYTGTITSLDSVVWNFGDGSMGTGINPMHTYSVANTYTVCVTAYTGCGNDTVCSVVNVTLAVPVISVLEKVNIYPNPAGDNVTIGGAQGCGVRVFNMLGQQVFEDRLTTNKQTENISHLVNGVYTIQLTNSNVYKKNIQLLKQ